MISSDEPSSTQVAAYEALAEKAYAEMYDSHSPTASYSDFKYYFAQAIVAAERAGMDAEAKRLSQRLDHCIQVYRSQFSGLGLGLGKLPTWNFRCPNCSAKLVVIHTKKPYESGEQANCPHCAIVLPSRNAEELLQYHLVETPHP
jgi:predicted RNA-binding Zn-ribbon protein involved in translation (DUF1610 family)